MPKDKRPKPGPDGLIERDEAKTWMAQNVVGKPVEFWLRVGDITLEGAEEGKYNVDPWFIGNLETMETKNLQGNLTIDRIEVHGIPCEVQAWGPAPLWSNVEAAAAKKLREIKRQDALLQARITEAEFMEGDDDRRLLLVLAVENVKLLKTAEPPWVKVDLAKGRFSAEVPVEPTVEIQTENDSPDLQGTLQLTCTAEFEGIQYRVAFGTPVSPARKAQARAAGNADHHLDARRDNMPEVAAALGGGKVVSAKKFDNEKLRGIDVQFAWNDGRVTRSRLVYHDGETFLMQVGSENAEDLTSPVAERFFKSMTIKLAAKPIAPGGEWLRVKEGPCTLLFPAKPDRSRLEPTSVVPVGTTLLMVQADGVDFQASVGDQPSEATAANLRLEGDIATRLKRGQEWMLQNSSGQLISEEPIRLGNHTGLEYTVLCQNGRTERYRNFIISDRTYNTMVGSAMPSDVMGPDAEKYFQSLQIEGLEQGGGKEGGK